MTPQQQSILSQKIADSTFSAEFKAMAKANNLHTLQDIVDKHKKDLQQLPGSGYRMLKEFLDVLHANGLMHLVD